ncbi:GtrA family protein [Capillibacterium thermochitinicola]|uniref:GtrA family protein n=1 Tax=Capillibacterium thermochitinicola TaxID=2699427 RepID=A0A8J6HSL0_9FIRM|nr:GtrA family protein [Capillibacterium thermochitinicola]
MTKLQEWCRQQFVRYFPAETRHQFIRYLITGFSSFGLEYSLFYLFYRGVRMPYLWANTLVMTIVFWFNFLMNRYWTFKSKQKLRKQLPLYGLIFFFNIGVSNLLMYLLAEKMSISPLISKVLAMGFIVMWTFTIYRKVIYKD